MKNLKTNFKKTPNDLDNLHPDFPEGKEMPAGHVGVFCQNLGILHTYTLENYSSCKIIYYLTMAVFLNN